MSGEAERARAAREESQAELEAEGHTEAWRFHLEGSRTESAVVNDVPVDAVLWDVVRVVSVTDGDTLRVVRTRVENRDGRRMRLTDDDPDGCPVRLMWVDTPEKRDREAWLRARTDLRAWVEAHSGGRLQVLCMDSGGWDRVLADLRSADGESASHWLMTYGNGGAGWPPYVP